MRMFNTIGWNGRLLTRQHRHNHCHDDRRRRIRHTHHHRRPLQGRYNPFLGTVVRIEWNNNLHHTQGLRHRYHLFRRTVYSHQYHPFHLRCDRFRDRPTTIAVPMVISSDSHPFRRPLRDRFRDHPSMAVAAVPMQTILVVSNSDSHPFRRPPCHPFLIIRTGILHNHSHLFHKRQHLERLARCDNNDPTNQNISRRRTTSVLTEIITAKHRRRPHPTIGVTVVWHRNIRRPCHRHPKDLLQPLLPTTALLTTVMRLAEFLTPMTMTMTMMTFCYPKQNRTDSPFPRPSHFLDAGR